MFFFFFKKYQMIPKQLDKKTQIRYNDFEVVNMKDTIQIDEIKAILKKYNIGKKPLSLMLGWGETTIIRYLDGQKPDQIHSDILRRIKVDEEEFTRYLNQNKKLLTKVAYKKVMNQLQSKKEQEDQIKIYIIAKYIIAKTEDITPLSLQKILYFIEGFSLALLGKPLLMDDCVAWVHGPVYVKIYHRFRDYGYHLIEQEKFKDYDTLPSTIPMDEIKLIDKVTRCFACYSGKILEEMTHLTTPWREARQGLDSLESSSNIISSASIEHFFKEICDEYHILKIEDISRYSKKIFNQVMR